MPRFLATACTIAALTMPLAASPVIAAPAATAPAVSPARCAPGDPREPGIQGEVPAGQTPAWHCGLRVVGQLPLVGSVAGTGRCLYVRTWGGMGTQDNSQIHVIDTRNPARPVQVGAPLPVRNGSESLRLVVTPERAIMVSGSTVFDIRDCLNPRLLGDIAWPDTRLPGIARKNLPHDIRINPAGTRVWSSFGLWEIDLGDLTRPESWKVIDHRCTVAAQIAGPWQEIHRASLRAGRSLCDDARRAAPMGANYTMGASPLQASLLWPQVSHGIDFSADGKLLFTGDQSGGNTALWAPRPHIRVFDITGPSPRLIGEADGPGHGMDWFRAAGREWLLHSNEGGTKGIMGQPDRGDTCRAYPRPTALGWGFEALVSEVSNPASPRAAAMLRLAINDPEHCEARKASGRDPYLAYHLINDPMDATFTAVNFGDAGLRVFDIRNPEKPVEVAYFNHGEPVHAGVGHWDVGRKLLFFADKGGLKVLRFQPQVERQLGL